MSEDNKSYSEPGEFVQMTVAGITLDPTNNMPIIILKDIDNSVAIPIWIGLVEASAIATELEGVELGRPMTHDLLKSVMDELGGSLQRVVVTELKENTFYAFLYVARGDKTLEIDSRPSDAIALALRTRSEIFVAKEVIKNSQQLDMESLQNVLGSSDQQAAKDGDGKGKKSKDQWTEILENLKPEDFGKYKM